MSIQHVDVGCDVGHRHEVLIQCGCDMHIQHVDAGCDEEHRHEVRYNVDATFIYSLWMRCVMWT